VVLVRFFGLFVSIMQGIWTFGRIPHHASPPQHIPHGSWSSKTPLLGCLAMLVEMLRDLVAHKGHANAALLHAIRQNGRAASDPELRELLHHILLANRFWLLAILGLPFVLEDEDRRDPSFGELVQRYGSTQGQESAWLDTATEGDLVRILENALIPNGRCSVAQAFMQVCLHSHGHRAQAAKLLRRHGGVPPATDFILWLTNRPPAEWAHTV
jgi:uncharacterized damage-inducible protein DinB